MPKRLGIIRHLYAEPVFYGLKQPGDDPRFELEEDIPAQLALKLRQRQLDGAFLSPIDYAKDYILYRIIPHVCAASSGESNTVWLFFKESLRSIRSLVVNVSSSSEVVLAHLLLKEKYDITPRIVPANVPFDEALEKGDAVLLTGDLFLEVQGKPSKIDLVDEWTDLTGFSFIHGIWVSREDILSDSEMNSIIRSSQLGNSAIDEIAVKETRRYLDGFQYELDERVILGLTEFFRMAFYHGILEDMPDVKFHAVRGQAS